MRTSLKIALAAVAVVLVALAGLLAGSPFRHHPGDSAPRVIESVDIAASCRQVFTYLGDSSHAHGWSVFVDHITPLNPEVTPDGTKGSIRRSFRRADETGMRWDELFLDVEPDRRRLLRIYNMVDGSAPKANHLLSEQLYHPLANDGCRLAFTVSLETPPSLSDQLSLRLAAWPVARVFRRNIGNVKRLVEAAR